ncbi:glycosyltransferase family 4 protein [Calditrichota bacterium LG25]
MKIVLFHQYFLGKNDPGGSRWNQMSAFLAQYHDFHILAGNVQYITGKKIGSNTFFNKEILTNSLTVYRTWTYRGYNTNFVGRLVGYLSYSFSSLVTALLLRKVDLIIVTSPPLFVGLSALLAAWIKRIPLIFEVRDLWPESAIATNVITNRHLIAIMYWVEKLLYKRVKKIVVLTPAFQENIIQRFPEFKDKIELVTNGADFDLMQPSPKHNWVREKYGWGNKKVFAYFGAHGVANDLIQVVETARLLKDREDILFVLIGDGMQKELLKEKAREYHLKNVQFIDSVPKEQVADFINASDVCMAILKKTDTFKTVYPNKVFDYMACKKPVLVTIDGITRKLIENACAGFYSPPGDYQAFKQTVEKMANLPDLELNKMGENGYAFIKEHFDRKKLAQKYLSIINKLQSV